jgi:thiamine-monophosphate kinase
MESEFLDWLRQRLPAPSYAGGGPGDDAAILRWHDRADLMATVDVLTDTVDFRLTEIDPRRAGRKALAVNLSDAAAMACRPVAALVGLVVPRAGGLHLAQEIFEGLLPLAEGYDVAIAGGDTNSWEGPLVISVTLLAQVTSRGPLRRGGAVAGDMIVVTGRFGGSILGKHLDFEPRVREALLLNERYELHAGIDVSDGLSLDLAHVAAASGCGAQLDLARVPIAPAAHALVQSRPEGSTALEHALADGEDFELILAVPPDVARRMEREQPLAVPLSIIGQFVAEPGLWQIDAHGRRGKLTPQGYEH